MAGRFEYQARKFAAAKDSLRMRHPMGDAQAIADAFLDCTLALADLDRLLLDSHTRALVVQLEWFMNTAGIEDPGTRGKWVVMAERFNQDEKREVARVIDELAEWFQRRG